MPSPVNQSITMIPHEVMLARLEQADQMREFFVQMWLQNPDLAKNAGERILALLEPMNAAPNKDFTRPVQQRFPGPVTPTFLNL